MKKTRAEVNSNTIPKSKKAVIARLQEEDTATRNIVLTNKTDILSSNFTSNTSYTIYVSARTSVGYGQSNGPVEFTTSIHFQGTMMILHFDRLNSS